MQPPEGGEFIMPDDPSQNSRTDARRAISVTERQRYILRVRALSRAVAEGYFAQREKLGFPGLKAAREAA